MSSKWKAGLVGRRRQTKRTETLLMVSSTLLTLGHQADELLPKEYLRIIITIENDLRKFEFIPVGEKYEKLMEVFKNE